MDEVEPFNTRMCNTSFQNLFAVNDLSMGSAILINGDIAFDWVYDHKDEIASHTKKLAGKAVDQAKEIGKDVINFGGKGINQMSQVAKIERGAEKQIVHKVNELGKHVINQITDKGKNWSDRVWIFWKFGYGIKVT